METRYNFEEIWKQRETHLPDRKTIQEKAQFYSKKQLWSSILLILSLLASFGTIVWVWLRFPDLHFMTKSGMLFAVSALILYIFLNFQKIKIINKINPALSNQEYLKQMKILQQKDLYMQTKGISQYYLLLSLGMAFYLFEFAERMSLFWGIFTYTITFSWILFGWFYIRPRKIRNQQKKISQVILSLEKIENEFSG